MNQNISIQKRAKAKESGCDNSVKAHYLEALLLAPEVKRLMGKAELVKKDEAVTVRSASDYSYSATFYAKSQYRIVGDAGGKWLCFACLCISLNVDSIPRSLFLLWSSPCHLRWTCCRCDDLCCPEKGLHRIRGYRVV